MGPLKRIVKSENQPKSFRGALRIGLFRLILNSCQCPPAHTWIISGTFPTFLSCYFQDWIAKASEGRFWFSSVNMAQQRRHQELGALRNWWKGENKSGKGGLQGASSNIRRAAGSTDCVLHVTTALCVLRTCWVARRMTLWSGKIPVLPTTLRCIYHPASEDQRPHCEAWWRQRQGSGTGVPGWRAMWPVWLFKL